MVLPCLNEEESVGICVAKARGVFDALGMEGEVIVVDNGSSDRSIEVAEAAGASVILESRRGYGRALQTGFEAASGAVLVMADGDDTYDLTELPHFLIVTSTAMHLTNYTLIILMYNYYINFCF